MQQAEFFEMPVFDPLADLLAAPGKPATIVIGCGKHKRRSAAPARELYTSPRFKMARASAEALGAKYYIMSARHGLVRPEQVLDPYDVDLNEYSQAEREVWSERIVSALDADMGSKRICLLATANYCEPILARGGKKHRPPIVAPLAGVDAYLHDVWHRQALAASQRYGDLSALYGFIARRRAAGDTFQLAELGQRKVPLRGVYIFLDPKERNAFDGGPRIVRIGTHAVSAGSKSNLRGRLRQHLGVADGAGNHRGSIFRLHVGRALLERSETAEALRSWGQGQSAGPDTRALEVEHERLVSAYLRKLEVLLLDVDDEPSKDSMRAHVESQLIALMSQDLRPLDVASAKWLGRRSPLEKISKSGLWNLRDVGRAYEPMAKGGLANLRLQGLIDTHA